MSIVVMHNVVSVDGYIADDSDDVGPLFEWYFNGDAELVDGGSFKVSRASAGYVRPMWDSIGSMVIGRHLFDLTSGTAVSCSAMRSSLTCPSGRGRPSFRRRGWRRS